MTHLREGKLVAAAIAVLLASSNGNAGPPPVAQVPAGTQQAAPLTAQTAAQQPLSARLGMYAFPNKGQSASQQSVAESECFNWAKSQTGVDPFNLESQHAALANTQPAPAGQGSAVRGTAGGAAIGAIAGNAGKGAAIGATVGLLHGRRQRKQAEADHASSSAAASASLADQRAHYNKAFAACLEGKGYTVK